MDDGGIEQVLAGVDSRPRRRVVRLLADGGWWSLGALVRESALSRRGVEDLLARLPVEASGDRVRLAAELGAAVADDGPGLAEPVGDPGGEHPELLERMRGLVAGGPRARRGLDHVSATPETVVRRAMFLAARFRMAGARLLCVGDHDLTSLAVAQLCPEAQVMVVDVDDRILAYIDEQAERLELAVHTRWADLRLGLAPSAWQWADLAVTDPPYTPHGVGLFVARAVQGLRDRDTGRVLLAYGAGERSPTLALKVQQALTGLNLLHEAVYPGFNRYDGAEAIGGAADLYLLRPTTKTAAAVRSQLRSPATGIYTQGPQAAEAAQAPPPPPDPGAQLLVGDWPGDVLPRVPRARAATWLDRPHPAAPDRVAIAAPPGMEAAVPRLLLAARASHVTVAGAAPSPAPAREALGAVYDIAAGDGVLTATRIEPPRDPARAALRAILDHAHGKLANTWREALIRAEDGLTKKDARARVLARAPWAAEVTPLELPLHRLRALPRLVAESLGGR